MDIRIDNIIENPSTIALCLSDNLIDIDVSYDSKSQSVIFKYRKEYFFDQTTDEKMKDISIIKRIFEDFFQCEISIEMELDEKFPLNYSTNKNQMNMVFIAEKKNYRITKSDSR